MIIGEDSDRFVAGFWFAKMKMVTEALENSDVSDSGV